MNATTASAISERLLVATRNPGKLRELRALFGGMGMSVIDLGDAGVAESPDEDLLEVHDSFVGNALAKARYYHRLTRIATVADDSGLAVAYLNGAPGVHSKRYAGAAGVAAEVERANNAKLQAALATTDDRRAKFVCAAAYVDGDVELVAIGESTGTITREPRGADGFGYDPYFLSDELGATFAESALSAKERVSHRGRAFRALMARLLERAGPGGPVDAPGGPG